MKFMATNNMSISNNNRNSISSNQQKNKNLSLLDRVSETVKFSSIPIIEAIGIAASLALAFGLIGGVGGSFSPATTGAVCGGAIGGGCRLRRTSCSK